ncbi:zinc knuckle (CCHC-type) family protein [Striga asiatica]|uniref:Zinc knuckle (CCHC-type) family protein n=1 Tax=Striga asiatica TaxID=4170 RepID=A0A5A7QYQ2_STRAF|nr:zinc knuckle (CCHC-type) family protein [Striga asiatica]
MRATLLDPIRSAGLEMAASLRGLLPSKQTSLAQHECWIIAEGKPEAVARGITDPRRAWLTLREVNEHATASKRQCLETEEDGLKRGSFILVTLLRHQGALPRTFSGSWGACLRCGQMGHYAIECTAKMLLVKEDNEER